MKHSNGDAVVFFYYLNWEKKPLLLWVLKHWNHDWSNRRTTLGDGWMWGINCFNVSSSKYLPHLILVIMTSVKITVKSLPGNIRSKDFFAQAPNASIIGTKPFLNIDYENWRTGFELLALRKKWTNFYMSNMIDLIITRRNSLYYICSNIKTLWNGYDRYIILLKTERKCIINIDHFVPATME